MIKVSRPITQKLLGLPESGMGFQIVEATFSDSTVKDTLILNATLAEPLAGRSPSIALKAMLESDVERLYKSTTPSTDIIDVRPKPGMGTMRKSANLSEAKTAIGAIDAPVELTVQDEYFIRFSRFEEDTRVDFILMCLKPGAFATTFDDANYCLRNGIDPISRYALPASDESVKYAIHVKPLENTPIQRGIVQPNHGQQGGGAEVLFPQGTQKRTVLKMESLGEERT